MSVLQNQIIVLLASDISNLRIVQFDRDRVGEPDRVHTSKFSVFDDIQRDQLWLQN